MIDLKSRRGDFEKHVDFFTQEMKTLRTGRANAALVEHITVDSYGTPTPLQHTASISVTDAKTIVISPWDKSLLKEIEKAIVNANIGVNPVNDGAVIRVIMPNLTEENRKALVKTLHQKMEQSRVAIRGLRDEIKDAIQKAEKAKEITEDDRYALVKELDDLTREYSSRIDELGAAKEKDIMTV